MENILRLVLIPVVLFFSTTSDSQENEKGINVHITNLRNNKGHVLISLYKDGHGYPDKPEMAYRISKVSISNKTTFVTFSGLPAGNYSIALLHDENNDTKMNTNFFGIPKEGYGFSNNVMGTFGPPSLSKATFHYTSDERKNIAIRVRY